MCGAPLIQHGTAGPELWAAGLRKSAFLLHECAWISKYLRVALIILNFLICPFCSLQSGLASEGISEHTDHFSVKYFHIDFLFIINKFTIFVIYCSALCLLQPRVPLSSPLIICIHIIQVLTYYQEYNWLTKLLSFLMEYIPNAFCLIWFHLLCTHIICYYTCVPLPIVVLDFVVFVC